MNSKKKWYGLISVEVASSYIPGISLVSHGMGAVWNKWKKQPKSFNKTIDLYKKGQELLKSATSQIVTLSTLRHDDGETEEEAIFHDDYYLDLYCKMICTDSKSPMKSSRYLDQRDERKCSEAITLKLLTDDKHCSIHHTETPIEMVLADDRSALVGFPDANNTLAFGVTINDKDSCAHLQKWREQIRNHNSVTHEKHSDDCLCSIVDWVSTSDEPTRIEKCFDRIVPWYDHIYKEETYKLWLKDLISSIEKVLPRLSSERKYRVLDMGCGTALGADHFLTNGFDYEGVDVSKGMIERARDNSSKKIKLTHEEATRFLLKKRAEIVEQGNEKYDVVLFLGNSFDYFLG